MNVRGRRTGSTRQQKRESEGVLESIAFGLLKIGEHEQCEQCERYVNTAADVREEI